MPKKSKPNSCIRHEQQVQENIQNDLERKINYTMHIFESTCNLLISKLSHLKYTQGESDRLYRNFTEFWIKGLDFQIDKYEIDRFAGQEKPDLDPYEDYNFMLEEEFWKHANAFYNCRHLKWTIRFTKQVKNKVLQWNHKLRVSFIRYLVELGIGSIKPGQNCTVVSDGPCANMVYFKGSIKGTGLILFAILMDRLPVVKLNKVVQFRYEQYLKVIDVVKREKDLHISIEHYRNSLKNDPDRWIEPYYDYEGIPIYPSFSNSVIKNDQCLVLPKPISYAYINPNESNSIIFNSISQRWETK